MSVCYSVCWICSYLFTQPHSPTCSFLGTTTLALTPSCTTRGPPNLRCPPDMFKLVHFFNSPYLFKLVHFGKRTLGHRLEGLLVSLHILLCLWKHKGFQRGEEKPYGVFTIQIHLKNTGFTWELILFPTSVQKPQ